MNDLRRELCETRYGAPHMRIEVCLRASPKGAEETILTVIRNGDWSHFDRPQATRQLCHGWEARYVKVKDLRYVAGYQPEGVATRRVPREQDDTVPCDTP